MLHENSHSIFTQLVPTLYPISCIQTPVWLELSPNYVHLTYFEISHHNFSYAKVSTKCLCWVLDGSLIKSTCYSCREPGFGSQNPRGYSPLSLTLVLGIRKQKTTKTKKSPSSLCGLCTYMIHLHTGKTLIYIK